MFEVSRKAIKHGIVTVAYPQVPIRTEIITGRPVVDEKICNRCEICLKMCPTEAISLFESVIFDLSRCIFCSHCADICPSGAINMSHDFELASFSKEELQGSVTEVIGNKLKHKIHNIFGRSLNIREVDTGSCNGCESEINSMNSPYNDLERFGLHFSASPRHADMLLITGPVSVNMEVALRRTCEATPDPKIIVAAGSCACSGGIFRGSYAVKDGVDNIIPVDLYIPGCPPRPQSLLYGILKAIDRKK